MQKDWAHCTFDRAENLSVRILALLRRDGKIGAGLSEDAVEVDRLLRGLKGTCEQICVELATFPGEDVKKRLKVALVRAEEELPEELNKLEQFLFSPLCQERIIAEELDEIAKLRQIRQGAPLSSGGTGVKERARQANLCGLALSGGGIRSATFNLGLLQGMAKHGVLTGIDYLSMVSGGGYIGGWLAAWIKRDGFAAVQRSLCDEESSPRDANTRPLALLRDYGSYLTPQTGLFSADTWTAFMTWVRNTFLNLIVLLSGLSAVLLIPRLLKSSQISLQGWLYGAFLSHLPEESLMLITVVCEIVIIVHAGRNLRQFKSAPEGAGAANLTAGFGYAPRDIQRWIIFPALLAAALGAARLWGLVIEVGSGDDIAWLTHLSGLGAMVLACFALLAYLQWRGGFVECYVREKRRSAGPPRMARFLCFFLPFVVATLKAALLGAVYLVLRRVYSAYPDNADAIAVTIGTPLLLIVFSICIAIHMGLMGRNFPDDRREWWSSIAAYLGIYAAGISTIFGIAFFGKDIVKGIAAIPGGWVSPVSGWALTTAGGLFFAQRGGRDKGASEKDSKSTIALNAFIALSPAIFVMGLFIILSAGLDTLLHATESYLPQAWHLSGPDSSPVINPVVVLGYLVCMLVVMFGFASTVDVNEFSMHHFYRNRLIRAYLGASHCKRRRPNRLTGFDQADDLTMASLRPECEPGLQDFGRPYEGPYPLFNATLNLVHGDRLAWQERKAASFVFTPKFCGYDYERVADIEAVAPLRDAGFRPTVVYAYPDGGIHLGTAMAISGAALSPNSGFHTSTSLAFLLTVFNVRLGWWIGNPRNDKSWQHSGPRFGLMYLVYELFGWTNDRQKQVYLSDGGHFDNLGIYELVRRRCSLIISSDAEEDVDCSFHGLGGVIRKCFIDFGVRIDVNLVDIRPATMDNRSQKHFAIGRIHYPEGWSGTLLYIKSSLSGDEPADLTEYMARRQNFPNQSTADQFFDESQFESYHRLGLHIAKCAFGPGNGVQDGEEINKIRQRDWAKQDSPNTHEFWTQKTSAAAAGD